MKTSYSYRYSAPTWEELQNLRAVAGGKREADYIIRNGLVVHVHSGEISHRDVVVCGRHIAALSPPEHFQAKNIYDAGGQYIVPNFIEAHFHIAYSMLTPGELARLIVPKGTTTLLADPNCIANILGKEGVAYIHMTHAPLRIFLQVSSSVPRTPGLELGGHQFSSEDIGALLQKPYAVSLGESVPFDLSRDAAKVLAHALAAGKRANGHTARLQNEQLWSYFAGGICDDHNGATLNEIMEILRLGGGIAIQSGSMSDYLSDILCQPDKLGLAAAHIFFSADDKHVGDLAKEGHIDHHVRKAVALGVEPVTAIRMASLNAAVHFRIDHLLGSVTPSRLADFMLLPDLKDFRPSAVFVGGRLAAQDGRPLFENIDVTPDDFRATMHLGPSFGKENLKIPAPRGKAHVRARVVELYNGYYKRLLLEEMPVHEGELLQDVSKDILKVAVADRHQGSGKAGVALIRGVGIQKGAIASTNNCENQNIVVIGTDDGEMLHAIRTLQSMGGGYCLVSGGQVIAKLPLPVGGVMSDEPWQDVACMLENMNEKAAGMGCRMHSPFINMAFIGLVGVPELGLTELGLIDVATQQFVDVVVSE